MLCLYEVIWIIKCKFVSMWVCIAVHMFMHVHMSVFAGACLFGHMYIGNVLLCAHICMHWPEYSWKVSSLTWGEVWDIHTVVPVAKGPVIPEPELCVGESYSGLHSWRRGCHSREDSQQSRWKNMSVLLLSLPPVPGSGLDFREAEGRGNNI